MEERATGMLVDMRSAVTIISEETWRRALPGNHQLQAFCRSVVAANGQRLQVLGTDTVSGGCPAIYTLPGTGGQGHSTGMSAMR